MVEHREHRGRHVRTIIVRTPTEVEFITVQSRLSIVPGTKTTSFTWGDQSGLLLNGHPTEIRHLYGTVKFGELDPDGYVRLILTTPHLTAVIYNAHL